MRKWLLLPATNGFGKPTHTSDTSSSRTSLRRDHTSFYLDLPRTLARSTFHVVGSSYALFFLQILEAAVTLPKIFSSASIHYTSLCSSKKNSGKGETHSWERGTRGGHMPRGNRQRNIAEARFLLCQRRFCKHPPQRFSRSTLSSLRLSRCYNVFKRFEQTCKTRGEQKRRGADICREGSARAISPSRGGTSYSAASSRNCSALACFVSNLATPLWLHWVTKKDSD